MARTSGRECSTQVGSVGHKRGKWVIKLTVRIGMICQMVNYQEKFSEYFFSFTVGLITYHIEKEKIFKYNIHY